jgi:hypothetical protein
MPGIGFLLGGAVGLLGGPAKASSEVVRQHLELFTRRVVVCPPILRGQGLSYRSYRVTKDRSLALNSPLNVPGR